MARYPEFLKSELEHHEKHKSLFHVFPVPYERTVSYGMGTENGPKAILDASSQLETLVDTEEPVKMGIYTHPEISPSGKDTDVMDRIEKTILPMIQLQKIPVVLGGEHTVTFAAVKAFHTLKRNIFVFQIDAHADLREEYESTHLSHACVMRRILELEFPIVQAGIRALCKEESDFIESHNICSYSAKKLCSEGMTEIELPQGLPNDVYITIDVDGLDPSIFPATGTPVPGGLGWYQTLSLIESIVKQKNVVGFDLVELAPRKEDRASEFAAARLVYEVMGMITRKITKPLAKSSPTPIPIKRTVTVKDSTKPKSLGKKSAKR